MRTISLCVIAAAMVAIGLRVWVALPSTPVARSVGQGVDPSQMTTNTRGHAPAELLGYKFIFH